MHWSNGPIRIPTVCGSVSCLYWDTCWLLVSRLGFPTTKILPVDSPLYLSQLLSSPYIRSRPQMLVKPYFPLKPHRLKPWRCSMVLLRTSRAAMTPISGSILRAVLLDSSSRYLPIAAHLLSRLLLLAASCEGVRICEIMTRCIWGVSAWTNTVSPSLKESTCAFRCKSS